MAELVLKDPFVSINSVDLSDHVRSITINYNAELQDKTASGDGTRAMLPGLLDWSVDVEFNQDYAASEVDATLFSLVGAAEFAVEFRSDTAAVSATNPKYTANALLESYVPLGGTVGETLVAPITLRPGNSSHALARATA